MLTHKQVKTCQLAEDLIPMSELEAASIKYRREVQTRQYALPIGTAVNVHFAHLTGNITGFENPHSDNSRLLYNVLLTNGRTCDAYENQFDVLEVRK